MSHQRRFEDYFYLNKGFQDGVPVFNLSELPGRPGTPESRSLGDGEFGEVWIVQPPSLGTPAAYKCVKEKEKDPEGVLLQLQEEAKALLVFDNAHIVPCRGQRRGRPLLTRPSLAST